MKVPLVDVTRLDKETTTHIESALRTVFLSGHYILGDHVAKFEKEFAKFSGAKYAVGVANGTDGLLIALRAAGVKPGDEVITVSHTFIATALAITYAGATPVFVDIEEKSMTMDTSTIESKITKKTTAILPVCLYGQSPNMTALAKIAKKHNLKLIIDACQSHGATYDTNPMGVYGDCVVYSFYPTKNLGCLGDGGCITTNNKEIQEKLITYRNVGRTGWYEHEIKGYNSRLDTMQAAVLSIKLKKLRTWNKERQRLAARYDKELRSLPLELPEVVSPARSVFYLYVIRTDRREELQEFLKANGITSMVHYPLPIHLQKAYRELGYKKGAFPVSEKIAPKILSIPLFPGMTDKEQSQVIATLKKFFTVPIASSKTTSMQKSKRSKRT